MKRLSAKVRKVNWPALRCNLYRVDCLPKGFLEFRRRGKVSVTIPSERIQVIFFRPGRKLHRLGLHRLLPAKQRPTLPLDFTPRNGFDLARPYLVHATGDYPLPG